MTYAFNVHANKTETYTVTCGDDNPVSIDVPEFGPLFPFPVGDSDGLEYSGGPVPAGKTITGSTTVFEDNANVTWTWKLTRQD
ncbi:MAG: hypothetical protein ACM3S1_12435 [Hyphomicrobiales bacterium]